VKDKKKKKHRSVARASTASAELTATGTQRPLFLRFIHQLVVPKERKRNSREVMKEPKKKTNATRKQLGR
jgi:hypothetical protein